MKYTNEYLSIFCTQITLLVKELTQFYSFMAMYKPNYYHVTWEYISIVADALTAYNELCGLNFFVTMKFFNPNN